MYAQSPIQFAAGINPEADNTNQSTLNIIDGDNIRFHRGKVEKIGGHAAFTINGTIDGCVRSLLSFEANAQKWLIIGTNTKLYALLGSTLYNITPLKTTAQATLGTDPLDFVNTDETMTVNYTAHGLAVGDRIKLTGATDAAGITAADDINIEHIVATVPDADSFTVELANAATSTASGGGSAIQIFYEIEDGGCDAVAASGPGIGTPGLGTPGSIQTDSSLTVQPRIWWLDTFGDILVCGAGQGSACYQWDGDPDVAPAVITNAPTADWGWVEDAKLVVFDGNVQTNSDTGSLTNWSTGSYFTTTRVDMTQFVARAYVNGENVIFSDEGRAFRLRFVGGTAGWAWREVDSPVQIASPNAHFVIGGVLYILGENNLFYYNGGVFYPIADNTLFKYMFDDINLLQRYKFFVWYNRKYDEVHFHYCSSGSSENDRAVFFRRSEGWFSKRSIERTAFDTSEVVNYPILANSSGKIYQHEVGYDDDGDAMESYFQIAYQSAQQGKIYTEIYGAELDLDQIGNMTAELYGKDRSKNTGTLLKSFAIAQSDDEIECETETRWRSWLFKSNEVGGFFRSGSIKEYVQAGGEF